MFFTGLQYCTLNQTSCLQICISYSIKDCKTRFLGNEAQKWFCVYTIPIYSHHTRYTVSWISKLKIQQWRANLLFEQLKFSLPPVLGPSYECWPLDLHFERCSLFMTKLQSCVHCHPSAYSLCHPHYVVVQEAHIYRLTPFRNLHPCEDTN